MQLATLIRPEMTCTAGLVLMSTLQFIFRFIVVKTDITPTRFGMAAFTGFLRVIFFVDVRLMNIFMAIYTTVSDICEFPALLRIFFMTGKTRCCQVGSVEFEVARIVPFDGIGRLVETKNSMAIGAIGHNTRFLKISLVIIGVAIGATACPNGIGVVGFMTFFAINIPVFAFQFIIGFIMIESVDALDLVERLLGMAVGTILPELVFMNIFMAVDAALVLNTFENLKLPAVLHFFNVAFLAFNFLVFPN